MKITPLYLIVISLFFYACSGQIPEDAILQETNISISPDYSDLVIPYNIAPLNFNINENADDYITVIHSSKGKKVVAKGKRVQFDLKNWKTLLSENRGDTIYIEIYLKKNSRWLKYPIIKNSIAEEDIDTYISYRLIEPSYVTYESMSINQRNLSNFEEKIIYDNTSLSTDEKGQCINCHSYQNYNKTGNMQFHVRQRFGGTILVNGNEARKVNLKTDYTISGGVYPTWHPTKNIIVYSVNDTGQNFHTKNNQKIEVMDTHSYLILYDIDKNEVKEVVNNPGNLETFPYWSADGKFLYYVSAAYPEGITVASEDMSMHYKKFHYNIYRKEFDLETYEFISTDTIFEASKYSKSATFPRESPDGRYLLFTLGEYGNFHIWHKSSDLYLLDMENSELRALSELNSPDVESYHSWSSNGYWIIFSSRRDDGSYTRPYIAYFKEGKASKPFVLPQKDPDFYSEFFKSYNIPEFMTNPVQISRNELRKTIKKDPIKASYYNPKKQNQLKQEADDKVNFYE